VLFLSLEPKFLATEQNRGAARRQAAQAPGRRYASFETTQSIKVESLFVKILDYNNKLMFLCDLSVAQRFRCLLRSA